jgi:hypothetical protein
MRYCLFFLALFAMSCNSQDVLSPTSSQEGYSPVYQSAASVKVISSGNSRPTLAAGKIYAYRTFIFQNDLNTGIHIIDNSNPSAPKKIGFVSIPFSTEVAVKGDFLYSNNMDDLVVFDISKPAEPKLVNRVADVFPLSNQKYPPYFNTAFECADPEKGVVVRWERKMLKDPKCRR